MPSNIEQKPIIHTEYIDKTEGETLDKKTLSYTQFYQGLKKYTKTKMIYQLL